MDNKGGENSWDIVLSVLWFHVSKSLKSLFLLKWEMIIDDLYNTALYLLHMYI